jgi:hypothetical protein
MRGTCALILTSPQPYQSGEVAMNGAICLCEAAEVLLTKVKR